MQRPQPPRALPHALVLLLAGLVVLACGPSPAQEAPVQEQTEPTEQAEQVEQTEQAPPAADPVPPNLADWLDLPEGVEAIEFPVTRLTMQTEGGPLELDIFIADTAARRQRGLMYATGLPPRAAMLFVFDELTVHSGFWNNNVPIDLHVAFLDGDGRIMEFVTLEARSQEVRRPAQPYRYALEMPAGRYVELGIKVGDQLVIDAEAIARD